MVRSAGANDGTAIGGFFGILYGSAAIIDSKAVCSVSAGYAADENSVLPL